MSILDGAKAQALTMATMKGYDLLREDFDGNLPKVVALLNRFSGAGDAGNEDNLRLLNMVAGHLGTPGDNWREFALRIRDEVDPDCARTFVRNFFVNSVALGMNRQRRVNERYGCNCPWAILVDPTTACNLHCNGCWAAHYEGARHQSLSYEELESIVSQGVDMGTFVYLFTGGEPLTRKGDIIRLCESHPDCYFSAFTNGTLVDERFADEMLHVRNFMPAFSIEGFEEATDARRGKGTFRKVCRAMDLLRERRLPFGASICYTSQNYDSVASDEFMRFLVDKGALFSWIFTYMPIGKDAPVELLATARQRAGMYHKVRDEWRKSLPIFLADFWNDGEYVGGCIAGGRRYLHINAAGDVEPCAFIHYSDSNIREKSLLECYQSPLFANYRACQPFNANMLRPCPLLDNPGALSQMVRAAGAHSTDYTAPEDPEEVEERCRATAWAWARASEPLWELSPKKALSDSLVVQGKSPTAWVSD